MRAVTNRARVMVDEERKDLKNKSVGVCGLLWLKTHEPDYLFTVLN
jgi:hypothetical protein